MKANKNPKWEIKECDKYYYHVVQLRRLPIKNVKDFDDHYTKVIYKDRGYADFLKNKAALGIDGDELVHDPRILVRAEKKKEDKGK